MSFILSTDTSANLPFDIIQQYDLLVLPFHYIMDGAEHECIDISQFDAENFYKDLKDKEVTTSMVNTAQYYAAWEPYVKQGHDILYIGMSSGISGAFGAAKLAVSMLKDKYPECQVIAFDSLAASLGEGLQVIKAAEYREQKLTLQEIMERLTELRDKIRQVFTVNDLFHLKRGGRLSSMGAVVGSMLNIKPILAGNEEGKIVVASKVKGRLKALKALAQEYATKRDTKSKDPIGIAQAACAEDAKKLEEMILQINPSQQIIKVEYEPVTGCHLGLGGLALFFQKDINRRELCL